MNIPHIIPVITFDGPSGTGKGTISQLLAKELGWHYLDSGSLFRVLAYAAFKVGVPLEDEEHLAKLVELVVPVFELHSEGLSVKLRGEDISNVIRKEEVGMVASHIATLPEVRAELAKVQKTFRQPPGLVTDGRDMGTVIFPDAQLKFYLDASPEERAKRRYLQLKNKDIHVTLAKILNDIKKRDARDKSRPIAPLEPAVDAIIIDTTSLNIEQVLAEVLKQVNKSLVKI